MSSLSFSPIDIRRCVQKVFCDSFGGVFCRLAFGGVSNKVFAD